MTSFPCISFRWLKLATLLALLAFPAVPSIVAAETPPAAPAAPVAAAPATPDDAAEATPVVPAPAISPVRLRLNEIVSVGGDARVLTNQVASEVVVVNGDAEIRGDVDGDVVVVFGHLRLSGNVNGDVVVVMGEADIDGEITGDTALIFSQARVGPNAVLDGEVLAVGVAPEIDPGATIRRTPEVVSMGPLMGYLGWARDYILQGVVWLRPFPPRVGWVWVAAGVFLVFHLVLALILAGPLRACMTTLREQPARSFLVGLLACILVGPVSLLLSFTVVATPLLLLVFFVLCLFGRVAVYGAAGAGLGRAGGGDALSHPFPAVLVGSVLFYLSYMIPLVGYLVYWLVLPWGVGACLIRLFEALRRERRPAGPGSRDGGVPFGPGGGIGARQSPGIGSGSPAAALAGGASGPATHAIVGEPSSFAATGPDAAPVPPTLGSTPVPSFVGNESAVLPRVGAGPRIGAAVIDIIVVAFVNGFTFGEARTFWIILALYHFGMWAWRGTTLGGTILGLRIVRLDGRPMDWQTSAVRVLASVVSLIPLGLGFIWASWDEQSQSWHDRIAGTTIVRLDRRVSLV